MKIRVAYVDAERQFWEQLDVPEDCTVQRAIEISGVLEKMPFLDLETNRVGIFGKFAKPEDSLKPGDRVEIYRKITADPLTVPRRGEEENAA